MSAAGRKIRDRIAKLQERVIASELRAAASLNGWGYPNTGPSLDPVPPHEVDGNTIPPASENVPHFEPYYPPLGVCPACSNSMGSIPIPCSQALTPSIYGSPPKEPESAHSSPPSITNGFYEAGLDFSSPDLSSALSNFPVAELNGPFPSDSWDQTQRSSSALYYVATGELSNIPSTSVRIPNKHRGIAPTDHANAGFRGFEDQRTHPDPASTGGRDLRVLAHVPVPDFRRVGAAYQPFDYAGLRIPVPGP